MRDYALALRRQFIEPDRHDAKLELLRRRYHAQGKYLLGEEVLAKRMGGRIYNVQRKSWEPIK